MDFREPFALDPTPAGWQHRTFVTRKPMTMSFGKIDGVRGLRFETDSSASMLIRHVDLDLDEYSVLSWNWYIERGISGVVDERTKQGDDHPARLYLSFEDDQGRKRSTEIIWGNRISRRGDYLHLPGLFEPFHHYVANGGLENQGRWHSESVDLERVYRDLWEDSSGARLTDIAVFCDSDETGENTVSWFSEVRMSKRESNQ